MKFSITNKIQWKYIACFCSFYLRFLECVLESNNEETIYLCFFRFVWGYDSRIKHTIGTCQIHWLTYQMIILYKYNIYRRLNYTLRMMINNNVFFFVRIPFYIYLLGSRLYGYILIVILLFSSVLCHVIKSGKSGNFQIFLLM